MKKFTLLCAFLLVGMGLLSSSYAAQFKFTSKPHSRILSSMTVTDRIFVPTNKQIGEVRVGVYCKVVRYSSLRIELTSPFGVKVLLKQEQAKTATSWPGSLGSEHSYCLFQDGGNAIGATSFPNDVPINPAQPLSFFDNTGSYGWWTLTVYDEGSTTIPQQDGYLEGWTLHMNSVTKEPEQVLWQAEYQGNLLQNIAFVNGDRWVPNPSGELDNPCVTGGPDAIVQIGKHGEAFGFYCPVAGTIGGIPSGMNSRGRFRITVSMYVNDPSNFTYNGDIAMYFGRVPTFKGTWTPTGNIINPATINDPVKPATVQPKTAKSWPVGAGLTTSTLQPAAASPTYGGVRLMACNSSADPNSLWNQVTGFTDLGFDDNTVPAVGIADAITDQTVYVPSASLSLLNGLPLQGMYYLSIYDTYGENGTFYGRMRVDRIRIEYVAGDEPVADPLHQGFAGPLMGVPIPGAITGSPFGYLADVICPMPPYSVYTNDQDPLLVYWAMGKMYNKTATGFERLETISSTGYTPPQGVRYTGPWSYPGTLDANPLVGGASINSDLIVGLPNGNYKFRTTLTQNRYDDDNSDNQFESNYFAVTPASLGYYGDQIQTWNVYQWLNTWPYTPVPIAPNTGVGVSFTVFKYPTSNLTSIDYRFDNGYATTPQANMQMVLYSCGGYFGAPSTIVAKSPVIGYNQYVSGNWRSFPMFQWVNGQLTTTSPVNLAPGTYVAVLQNVDGSNSYLIHPYTYGMAPTLTDRYCSYDFDDKFGPIAPYSTSGTRLAYYTTTASGSTTFNAMTSNLAAFANFTLPMRFNFPNQQGMANYPNLNDFAINYITLGGELANRSAPIGNFSATSYPYIYVSNNTPATTTTSCTVRLEIFDAGNTLVYAAPDYVMTFSPSQTCQSLAIQRPAWIPTVPGLYSIRATLVRKPNDQNPVNDQLTSSFYVSASRVTLGIGNNVSNAQRDDALEILKNRGMDVQVMNVSEISNANSDVYVLGDITTATRQNLLATNGTVAFMYDKADNMGKTIRNVDILYNNDRGNVNYDKMSIYGKVVPTTRTEIPVTPQQVTINSKEDLVNIMKSAAASIKNVDNDPEAAADIEMRSKQMYENTLAPGNVDITFVADEKDAMGILYTFSGAKANNTSGVDQATPAGFMLGQNFPNPFNPSTSISYNLPEACFVSLRIMDMLGREVAVLVNSNQEAGSYSTTWNGIDQIGRVVASGTYMYRIDATPVSGGNGYSSTMKMTLSK